jgi:REP element-mobilizing transposase RayT
MKQLEFKRVGGKRKDAGRPNRSGTVNHMKRPRVNFKKPLHLTLKLKKSVGTLRTRPRLKAFQNNLRRVKKFELRVLHYTLQFDHIHLIVEAPDNDMLSRGMKSLAGRLGRFFSLGTGKAFKGRYHLHQLGTPTEVKRAYKYVLMNTSKHQKLISFLDEFSSARHFKGWDQFKIASPLLEEQLSNFGAFPFPDYLSEPTSWLANVGWKKAA